MVNRQYVQKRTHLADTIAAALLGLLLSTISVIAQPVATRLQQETDPGERARSQLKLVNDLIVAGKKQDAVNELLSIAAEDRFDPQLFYNVGNALARLDNFDGAVRSYRKTIDQRKGSYSRAWNNLGVVLMREGKWQEATEALIAALRLENFRYAEASYNLGRLYAAQGEMDLALREWRRALAVNPEHRAAAAAITNARTKEQITVAASPVLDKKPDPKVDSRASAVKPAVSKVSSGNSNRVVSVDQLTYKQLQRARNAREHGRNDEAIESYRNVISRMGGYFAPADLELSYLLIGIKQPDAAMVYLRDLVARDGSRYPIGYYHLARLYELKGQLDLAAEAYSQAAKHFRGVNPQFLLDLSRVREASGDYKGSLAALEEYVQAMEQQGSKPEWSEQRLALLRQKVSGADAKR